ncbi:protein kinase domain-containing protein [Bailinhaonella thermotolerans]|uniref:Serine/threonine protein kinase n=1 Tax=Bailinhaonella thermotolerans TaxID=1070861 RepID=A0A3A4B505_9ACTN|nr:protein kinase [Bailinhaonella thermotolerans]RJL32512.1 serine/threonine protein kinase [Bailinhaonella thermotolerans]
MPRIRPLTPEDPPSIGGHRLVGRIGSGGQGVVYLGEDARGGRVAIKVLHEAAAADPGLRARFAKEVTAAAKVLPYCAARVLRAEVDARRPYIVSEYVDGPSLREAVETSGPFGEDALLRLATGTATALTAIHGAGIVHRDFKPDNVLLGPDGPRLIDFGIARSDEMTLTPSGMMIGTPQYIAPEVYAGERAGPPADVFAWGAVMVFAATGGHAFDGQALPAVMNRVLTAEPDLGGLPASLRPLVAAALSKDPAARPPALGLLLGLVGGGLDAVGAMRAGSRAAGAPHAPPTGPIPGTGAPAAPAPPPRRTATPAPPRRTAAASRRRAVLGAVAAAAVVAGGAAAGIWWPGGGRPGASAAGVTSTARAEVTTPGAGPGTPHSEPATPDPGPAEREPAGNGVPAGAIAPDLRIGPVEAYHLVDRATHAERAERLRARGMRPISLSVSAGEHYTAVWHRNDTDTDFVMFEGLDFAEFDAFLKRKWDEGYGLTLISATGPAESAVFAGVMEKGGASNYVYSGMTRAQFERRNAELGADGHILVHATAYGTADDPRFAGTWLTNERGLDWTSRIHRTQEEHGEDFARLTKEGFRPRQVTRSASSHYTSIWWKVPPSGWYEYTGMDAGAYEERVEELRAKDFFPVSVEVGGPEEAPRYNAIWLRRLD